MNHILHSPAPSPPQLLPPPFQPHSFSFNISRRSLAIITPLLLPTLSSSAEIESSSTVPSETSICARNKPTTKNVFIDVSIDGVPIGKITIGLYESLAPYGARSFENLVSGGSGVSYRRKEFIKIMPNYVQNAGIRSYGVDAEIAARTGNASSVTDNLIAEWEAATKEKCVKNTAGSVGIIVRNPSKPPPKEKIVAKQGKLQVVKEEVGVEPNGTEFVIVTKDSPELDQSVLVIGTVVDGMEVAEKLTQVKTVQDNTSSPYFRVAKLIGDKRAVVAERGFNRPYSKVIVTNCGISS